MLTLRYLTAKIPAFLAILFMASSFFLVARESYSKPSRYLGQTITRIDFTGNENTPTSELFELIKMRPGMTLTRELLNEDLKLLFQKESIAYARIEGSPYKKGVAVKFVIEEQPIVSSIIMRGVDELNIEELEDLIPLKKKSIYSKAVLERSKKLILAQYAERGFFNAAIRVEVFSEEENKNSIDVTFIIDEGEEIRIAKINFVGVSSIDTQDLYTAIEHQEKDIFLDGYFTEAKIESDKEKILEVYRSKGHLNAQVIDSSWEIRWLDKEQTKRVIVITYEIKEGPVFYFGGYQVGWDEKSYNTQTGQPLISKEEIEGYFENTEELIGQVLDYGKFSRDRGIINYLYSEQGYIFARVQGIKTEIKLTQEALLEKTISATQVKYAKDGLDFYHVKHLKKIYDTKPELHGKTFVHYHFFISEGDKGYIENIIIKGNDKTRTSVIRREMLVQEGDLFNATLVQRSREKIYNLGYFEAVNLDARPGSSEGKLNLIITVTEQMTGTLSLGGGYGTVGGFSIFTEIKENNLDGSGQKISGRVELGENKTALMATWSDPWLFGSPWQLSVSAFYARLEREVAAIQSLSIANIREKGTFVEDRAGVVFGIGHRLDTNWTLSHSLRPSFTQVSEPSGLADDSIYILSSRGWQFQNKLSNLLVYDDRDNVFTPTQGLRAEIGLDLVGVVLGGNDHYLQGSGLIDYYWWPFDFTFFNLIRNNTLRRWRVVLEHRFSVDYIHPLTSAYGEQADDIDPPVEYYDRLLIGGYESVRGWILFDSLLMSEWQSGGHQRVIFSSEFRIPIEPSLAWFVFYFDAGALFNEGASFLNDKSISNIEVTTGLQNISKASYWVYSWGFGFRVQVPMMPLRIYMGQRLRWDDSINWFTHYAEKSDLEVVVGIGDMRF